MIGLIVTGHGHFDTGLTSSLKLICGEDIKDYVAVDFESTDSEDDLAEKINQAFDDLKECEGILVLSDIVGGSPFKTSTMIGLPKGNVEIVSGTNLPMLIDVHLTRTFETNVHDFVNHAIEVGSLSVSKFEFKKVEETTDEEGI